MPRKLNIRQLALAVAALALFGLGSTAKADVVFLGVNPATGSGIGSVATILSIQNTNFESGAVAWNGTMDVLTGDIAAMGNTQTRTLSELGVTNGSELRIIFNINETGNETSDTAFVRLQILDLNIYGSDGTLLTTFSYSGPPLDLSQSSGIGGSGHAFGLDAAQAAELSALIAVHGADNLRIGINASVGCMGLDTDPRHCTDDGFETFFGGSEPIPEPTSMLLLGTGLLGLAGVARRRLRK